ncbi:MAG TPA: metallophosphoesterase [Candidatus Thermoplasmatota archaeon]|nr:metallophosphoesterase [Candidatus Thermoplasmatota archaeon]
MDAPAATPVFGERALHLPEAGVLVVGDLHVGLESDLRLAGVNLPSQTERMRARLLDLLARTGATRLVVIGDLKHRIPYSTRQEIAELPGFFRGFPARVELVRGNHDVDLEGLLDVEVRDASGIRVGDVGLLHGHVWPSGEVMGARLVVTCHNHPAVMMVDELGHRHKEPAWIRARFLPAARERYASLPPDAELVVMPAFNELTGGTAFNAPEGGRLLGPLFGNGLVDVDRARVVTVDGVDLGAVQALRRYGEERTRPRSGRGPKERRRPGWID